jgi:hypothetical protein
VAITILIVFAALLLLAGVVRAGFNGAARVTPVIGVWPSGAGRSSGGSMGWTPPARWPSAWPPPARR